VASTIIDPNFNLFFFHEINSKKIQSLNKINVYKKLYFVVIVKKKPLTASIWTDWKQDKLEEKIYFLFLLVDVTFAQRREKESMRLKTQIIMDYN
jgi:hypothetical protein